MFVFLLLHRLDPALIRPGRVDFIQQIGHCTNWQLQKMFSRFYPDAAVDEVRHFADEVAKLPYPVSPAMIQGHFMYHKVCLSFVDLCKISLLQQTSQLRLSSCVSLHCLAWHKNSSKILANPGQGRKLGFGRRFPSTRVDDALN